MKRSTWLYVGGTVAAVVAFVWWRSRSQASAAATAPYTSTPVYGYNPAGYNPQDDQGSGGGDLTPSGSSSSNYTDPASAGVSSSTGGSPTYVGGQSLSQSQYYPGSVPGTTSNTAGPAGTPIGPGLGGGTLIIGAPSGAWSPGGQTLHLYTGAVR